MKETRYAPKYQIFFYDSKRKVLHKENATSLTCTVRVVATQEESLGVIRKVIRKLTKSITEKVGYAISEPLMYQQHLGASMLRPRKVVYIGKESDQTEHENSSLPLEIS